jgi:Recombination endonuclease VII
MEVPKERQCSKCQIVKPLTEQYFVKNTRSLYGFTRQCRECRVTKSAEWGRNFRRSDKLQLQCFKRQLAKYNLTVEKYTLKLVSQSGLCAICNHLSHNGTIMERLHIDHSHQCCPKNRTSCGQCVRGLLCRVCNSELAHLERFLADLRNPENSLVDLRNALTNDSWTYRAMQYLRSYEVNLSTPWKTQETHK